MISRFLFKDEKIQDVLGHFQKDFEGGVTAENLGEWVKMEIMRVGSIEVSVCERQMILWDLNCL